MEFHLKSCFYAQIRFYHYDWLDRGNTSLWNENWLHKGRIAYKVRYIDIHDIHLNIINICQSGVWNFDILYTQLLNDIKMEMLSIVSNSDLNDRLTWEPSQYGGIKLPKVVILDWLIIKIPFFLFLKVSLGIGNLKFQKNIRFFVWLIMHRV